MSPRESDELARIINAGNRRQSEQAGAALGAVRDALLIVVLGVLSAWALWTWATPCEAGALCMAGAVHTRSGWLASLQRRLHAVTLRWRLRDLEVTLDRVEEDLADLPEIRDALRRQAQALRADLARLEG